MTSRDIRGEKTVLRRATDADADLIVRWHDDPDVARYWDGERFTRDEMLERLRRRDVESYIVEADGEPVGYLQVWQQATPAASTCSSSRARADAASARMPAAPSRAISATSAAGRA